MLINAEIYKDYLKDRGVDWFKREFHEHGKVTSVMIINASDDPANERYIQTKKKLLDEFGVRCYIKKFGRSNSQFGIEDYIREHKKEFDAIMIQTPIYDHLNFDKLMECIDYKQDIDGLHPMNQGLIYTDLDKAIIPCTALGVINMLHQHKIDYKMKNVVIIGRGKLVADPLAKILEYGNATVTKIHTRTDPEYRDMLLKQADIIISCVGKDMSSIINPNTVGHNLEALIGVGFRYETVKEPDKMFPRHVQLQDFDCNADWGDHVKVTSNTKATGLATVCALVDNLLQIKNR